MSDITKITGSDEKRILNPLCVDLVNRIFVKFALLFREYDALYADPQRENAEKTQWINAFMKNGITRNSQIKNAIDQTELHVYGRPPQLGQFLMWCKKPIKPQSDTRPDWMKTKGIESDEHKAKKKENALSHLSKLKAMLK